jgi:2-oxo-3-hexenedioate decarboxylase
VSATGVLDVTSAADELHAARGERRTLATLTSRWPDLTEADAYAVQAAGVALREADGEHVVGGKLGFTSRAMREAMGVDSPNYGWLTDAMILHGGIAPAEMFIHPKVEPEVAFVLDADLAGDATVDDVLAATRYVAPCLEVVDSRWDEFRFLALDNIADNSSAGGFVLGTPHPVDGLDLRTLGVVVTRDGELVHTAAGAAAHDHPAAAVAWMAAHADAPLRVGHVVISGGLTAPIDLTPGTVVTAEFDRLGAVTVRMPAPDEEP